MNSSTLLLMHLLHVQERHTVQSTDCHLSYLPLAHMYERMNVVRQESSQFNLILAADRSIHMKTLDCETIRNHFFKKKGGGGKGEKCLDLMCQSNRLNLSLFHTPVLPFIVNLFHIHSTSENHPTVSSKLWEIPQF